MRSRRLFPVLAVFLPFCLLAQSWESARPGYRFQFPRDHFSHPQYQTEWWYYTGNLRAANGHRYGFELTFFRQTNRLSATAAQSENDVWRPDQLYLGHLALSDIDGHSLYHTERLNRAGPGLAGAALSDGRYWNGNWQVRWTALPSARQELVAVGDRFTLRLDLQSAKPPVIQGQDGVSRKGPLPGQASHYISFTRLKASGRLQQSGSMQAVTGVGWMDHEFFTEPAASDLTGWDWFAIQLNNNEELMLYRLRNKSGMPDRYSSGSYVDAQGQMHFLSAGDFSLTPGEVWQSPHTHARYPVSWRISVPSLQLELTERTELQDQELWTAEGGDSPDYWEGAVTYQGTLRGAPIEGVGYLEMTGYKQPIHLAASRAPGLYPDRHTSLSR
jgi:predicted secreted hydrolase